MIHRRNEPHVARRVSLRSGRTQEQVRIVPVLMPLTAGTKLGPYEAIDPLGAGGMDACGLASDPPTMLRVDLSLLKAQCNESSHRGAVK